MRKTHKENCSCCICKAKRGETKGTPKNHDSDCGCASCKAKRGDLHKEGCTCVSCKVKRGEYHHSLETCKKIGNASKGRVHSPEAIKKTADANRGKHRSPETCKKIGDANKLHKEGCQCASCKSKRGETKGENNPFYGHHPSAEAREKLRVANTNPSAEVRENLRVKTKKLWQDSEYVAKQMDARNVAQNKLENFLQNQFDQFFLDQLKFTGDGQLIVAGKCPDFVHTSKKLIIELFGDYWHSQTVTGIPNEQHEQERIKLFESQGYKTLIIWEHELKDISSVVEKVREFIR